MNYLEELEKIRKKVWIKTIILILIIAFIIIYGLFIKKSMKIMFVLSILFYLYYTISKIKDESKYEKIYKRNITLEAFKSIFTNINYTPDLGMPKSVIESTNMMDTGDRYYSNDYISATYKGINFEFADVLIENEYKDKDGNSHYTTIFEGQWFIFDFNKKFKSNIQICEKNFYGAKRGSIFSREVYQKVQMEDVEFNKQFNTYAQNELEAFYILTPNTMEKIKKLNNEIKGKFLFCFIDNKLHIGLHNHKDLFEPNIYNKINIEKEKELVLKDIKVITNFIDTLELDNDLFKRRD